MPLESSKTGAKVHFRETGFSNEPILSIPLFCAFFSYFHYLLTGREKSSSPGIIISLVSRGHMVKPTIRRGHLTNRLRPNDCCTMLASCQGLWCEVCMRGCIETPFVSSSLFFLYSKFFHTLLLHGMSKYRNAYFTNVNRILRWLH